MASILMQAAMTIIALALTSVIILLLTILYQTAAAYLWLIYLRLVHQLHKIPEPPLPLSKLLSIGHDQMKLLFTQNRRISSKTFLKWGKQYGRIYLTRGLLGEPIVMVQSSSGISHLASHAHAEKYSKPVILKNYLESLIGSESLILAQGDLHKRLRKVVASMFHYQSLMSISQIFFKHANSLANAFVHCSRQNEHNDGCLNDILPIIHDRTFALIVDACFGDGVVRREVIEKLRQDYFACILEPPKFAVRRVLLQRIFTFLPHTVFGYKEKLKQTIKRELSVLLCVVSTMYTASGFGKNSNKNKKQNEYNNTDKIKVEEKNIIQNSQYLKRVPNLLSLVTDAQLDNRLSESETVSLIMTFISAGQGTTAFGFALLLYNLAAHEKWQDILRDELKDSQLDINNVNGEEAEETLKKLDGLPILERVVKESFRKDPPVSYTSRYSKEPDVIDGFQIPAGVTVRLPILAHQTDPEIWGDDADEFNPDRWLDKKLNRIPTFYSIFWHGSRNCIGQRFAILEVKAFVAAVITRGKLSIKKEDSIPVCSGPFANPLGLKIYMSPKF